MPRYAIGGGSKLVVKARSALHDTQTVWSSVSGTVDADGATLATAGAKARFAVDMTRFDAGDWLKNRKLKKDFDLDEHPEATFEITAVREVSDHGGRFKATADGVLRWRGREVTLTVAGEGTLDPTRLSAVGRLELDIRKLGLSAPRFLMIKMADEVTVEVTLVGSVS